MVAITEEQQALLVNTIHVLVAELNSKMDEAAQAGLRVHVSADLCIYIKEVRNPEHVSVRIFKEIR